MEQVNFGLFFGHLAVFLFIWVFAITTQGFLTAWMANHYGDDTAKNAGRISFSPFAQADLTGTIIIPAIAFVIGWMTAGVPFIAWGKRIPINSENFRNPKIAGIMVTLAAVFANLAIAVLTFALLKILFVTGILSAENFFDMALNKNFATEVSWLAPFQLMLWYSLLLNLMLVLFGLIPFPPFSGGVVLFSLLPESFKPFKDFFNAYGLFFAIALLFLGFIGYVLLPALNFVIQLLIT